MSERDHRNLPAASKDGRDAEPASHTGAMQNLADRYGAAGVRRFIQRRAAQRKASGAQSAAQPSGADAPAPAETGAGRPLPEALRAKMERSFGIDLSAVRIHEGDEAARMNAVAFTRGHDIFFQPGKYQPDTKDGQELIGHEVAHVVQQRGGRVDGPQNKGGINDDQSLENEADALGAKAARGEPAQVSGASAGAGIQRKGKNDKQGLKEAMTPAMPGSVDEIINPNDKGVQYLCEKDTGEKNSWGGPVMSSCYAIDGKLYSYKHTISACLGRGTFGSVYRLEPAEPGLPILAIKIATIVPGGGDSDAETKLGQRATGGAQTPAVSKTTGVKGSTTIGGQEHIVLDYMKNGTLDNLATKLFEAMKSGMLGPKQVWGVIQYVVGELAQALLQLGSSNMIHHDIKAPNVLLNDQMEPKLADFGTATVGDKAKSRAGTPGYIAPEVDRGEEHDNKADVYSLGRMASALVANLSNLQGVAVPQDRENGKELSKATQEDKAKHDEWAGRARGNLDMSKMKPGETAPTPEDYDWTAAPGGGSIGGAFAAFYASLTADDPAARAKASDILSHPFLQAPIISPGFAQECMKLALSKGKS